MNENPLERAQPRAQSALASSSIFDLRDLRVEQCDDALLISGSVSSFYHKQLAQELVRAVAHGIPVVNSIQVDETVQVWD